MKLWLPIFLSFSTLCLCWSATALAASGNSTGGDRDDGRRMGAPLAEMLLYEAAEQAVEDGYARIIPESEEAAASEKTAKAQDEHTESGSEAPVLESVEVVK